MKTTITSMIGLICMTCMANGIYFVSGVDFRASWLKYSVATESDNQTVQIAPTMFKTISSVKAENAIYANPWSLRTNGNSIDFPATDVVGYNTSVPGYQNLSAEDITYTYPKSGEHLVRVIDNAPHNGYQVTFDSITNLTYVYCDYEANLETDAKWGMSFQVTKCPNVRKIVWVNSPTRTINPFPPSQLLKNLVSFYIKYPEKVTLFANWTLYGAPNLTNDLVFVNATQVGNETFKNNTKVKYACFPKAVKFGSNAFKLESAYQTGDDFGLNRICFGDGLTTVGKDALAAQINIKTIEFATNESDWIGAWNSNQTLVNWLGTLVQDSLDPNKATLIVGELNTTYWNANAKRPGTKSGSDPIVVVKVEK